MAILSVDLGTTNVKVAVYDDRLHMLSIVSETVTYDREDDVVEFDPDTYFGTVILLIEKSIKKSKLPWDSIRQIVLTGQAESLVVVDNVGNPLRPGFSWLDGRGKAECEVLQQAFHKDACYKITGQPEIVTTWPIVKMLWLKNNEPSVFANVYKYLLLKDYIAFRLTGLYIGEYTIYNFSHYFDIAKKTYWSDILTFCGVHINQLPEVMPSGTVIGKLMPSICQQLEIHHDVELNIGALDHFASMIGTGNIKKGLMSESAGTVLTLATYLEKPLWSNERIGLNCGIFSDSYVMMPVCECGGVALEWFKNAFMSDISFAELDMECATRQPDPGLLFLPYIVGINAPDNNPEMSGVFYGLKAQHDKFDLALAVMEGVAHLLRRNIMFIEKAGVSFSSVISTGGGAKSALWCQLKADVTGHPVDVPVISEAANFGAAIMAAVSLGYYASYEAAVSECVHIQTRYTPTLDSVYENKHVLFSKLIGLLYDM